MTSLCSKVLLAAACCASAWACTNNGEFDQNSFTASLYGGSFGGMALALIMVILASLPLCCGVLKQYGKIIAGMAIVLGLVSLALPLLGSMGACGPFVDAICNERCSGYECSAQERDDMSSLCNALGFLVVYIGAFGWATCVLGIVAASLGCCVCCGCCKANMNEPAAKGGPPVVVGAVQQGA
ncbi:ESD [Symbiodinium natans]|uniref:ESD protein n=1 Tax=Symbiodinium natans TaxID=878477 RepID=A0A812RZK8_9DINO|nr:ESD [Symbiodinium natans]